ncbi:hypothetical protein ZIOFF_002710 [Zingiber officinale]|uniref:Uncharacterized protein n=1 Tax=Zingiber officinale TaxID=94328 RepID=A0A8J5M9J6_ZINOF|nr:hypothetical protein ZIOFF_002710 [Zingiber officinale]
MKPWNKQDIEFALGIVDLDLALREPEPTAITDTSSVFEKELHVKWDRSNRLSLIAIKRSIPEHLLTGLPETNNAKVLFEAIGQRYQVSNKAETGALMNELTSLRYDSQSGVREYVLKLIFLQSKLRGLNVTLPADFIVHHALNSLPPEFSQIKTAYNTQSESWTVNDLIAKCVLEEDKLKREKIESALLVSHSKVTPGQGHGSRKNYKKHSANTPHKDHSKGYRFYCPTPGARIVESQTAKFLEHDTTDLKTPQLLDIDKQSEVVPIPLPNIQTFVLPTPVNGIDQEQLGNNAPIVANAPDHVDPIPEVPVRRSVRQRRPAISDEFIVYLGESDYNVGPVVDPVTYAGAISSP